MKLFLIERTDGVDYDEYDSFVVRAENNRDARELAEEAGHVRSYNYETKAFEDKSVWTDENMSRCVELGTEGEANIILGSFNAG